MQRLFDLNFLTKVFKYFSFRQSNSYIHRYYFKDAIYEGEGYIEEKTNLFVKDGIGLFITSKGDTYFGEFKDNSLHGEGNFIFSNGSFLRGKFRRDKLHGISLISLANGDMFILNFSAGNLNGFSTYMPYDQNCAYVLDFKDNKFQKLIKQFYFTQEKAESARMKIVSSVFENSQLNETIYADKDIIKVLKRVEKIEEKYISSMLVENYFFYCGMFNSSLDFKGLGILIDIEGKKIRIGNWVNEKMNGYGFIIEEKYIFKGQFEMGLLKGAAIVKDVKTNQFKECLYDKGEIKEILKSGTGEGDANLIKFNKLDDIINTGYEVEETEYVNDYFHFINIINAVNVEIDFTRTNIINNGTTFDDFRGDNGRAITYANQGMIPQTLDVTPNPYEYSITIPKNTTLIQTKTDKRFLQTDVNPRSEDFYNYTLSNILNQTDKRDTSPDDHHKNKCWTFEDSYKKRLDYIQKNYFDNKWNK